MNDRYLFKAKRIDNGEWIVGNFLTIAKINFFICTGKVKLDGALKGHIYPEMYAVDESTLCQCTGLKDKNGTLIWENDILMCNNNPKDIVKAIFGEFSVIDVDSLSVIDKVVGWHYEVVPTDELSKCEPFCLSMSLTDFYIDMCDMRVVGSVFDNPELLEVE